MGMLMARAGAELTPSKINVGEIARAMEWTIEEMRGASEIPITMFKCPSGGGKFFACDDEELPPVSEIEGIIVSAHFTNVYWSTPMGEGNREPDCVSQDGLSGWYVEDGEQMERPCRTCPYNKMGSATNGRKGKACRNRAELTMLIEGSALPIKVSIPTMSVENYIRFASRALSPNRLKPWQISTKVTLKGATNSGGTKYSQMVFECTGRVNDEDILVLRDRVAPLLLTGGAQE